MNTAGEKFQRLVEIMARLRGPGGCPWDREQTFDTIKPYTLEETYEVLDAIDRRDWQELAEELGDFMLQAVFYAQMAAEQELFRIGDALDAINEKLVRRHPHVFGDGIGRDRGRREAHLGRDQGRREEGQGQARTRRCSGGVPRALPALVEAQQIASRAAGVGLRLGESGAGAREAARGARGIRRGAAQRARRTSWKTNWATCCSCW